MTKPYPTHFAYSKPVLKEGEGIEQTKKKKQRKKRKKGREARDPQAPQEHAYLYASLIEVNAFPHSHEYAFCCPFPLPKIDV